MNQNNAVLELGVVLGDPVVGGPLSLFPLFGDALAAPPYLTGPVAESVHALKVTELEDGAAVPELVILNAAALPVLLIEGETIVGVKQNRTLNLSVLCPPGERTEVAVSCVEAGRWAAPESASRSPRHAPQRLRALKTESVRNSVLAGRGRVSDQGAVWESVEGYAAASDVAAPTSALEDVFDAVDDSTRHLVEGLRPQEHQRGVLVGLGGRAVSVDLFDKPATLADYWDGLLAGYAIDAIGASDEPTVAAEAEAFLAALAEGTAVTQPASGLGEEAHLLHPRVTGAGLVWQGAVVHLAAFAVSAGGAP